VHQPVNLVPVATGIAKRWLLLMVLVLRTTAADVVTEIRQGQYGDALQHVDEQLKQQPGNPNLWTLRGVALSNLRKPEESLRSFERALLISPKSLPALEGAAETAYSIRDRRAAHLINQVLALQPENGTAHAMAGSLAVEAKDCTSAVDHFRRAKAEIADNALALSQYGACLIERNQPVDAVPPLEQALSLNRDSTATTYNLALALQLLHRTDESAALLQTLHPDSESLNLLAEIYTEKDRIPEAIAALRQATEIAPRDERNYIDLATLCLDHQSTELGIQIAGIGLKNIPNSAKLYALRGAIYAEAGKSAAAAADFEKAKSIEPDELYGSVGLSLLLRENAKLAEAETIVRRMLRAEPEDPTLNYLLADLLIRGGAEPKSPEFLQAIALLNRSIKAKPDFVNAHAALGKLYMSAGKAVEAVSETERTLELAPNDHVALNQLILAYRKLGRNEQAERAAQRLRTLLAQEEKQEISRNRIRLRAGNP
jgi:tetratricopeptide (TPR) repeat protein